MFDAIHRRMCEAVRRGDIVLTLHAEEELEADRLTIFDVESAILTGRIVERQRDAELGGWKYVLCGESLANRAVATSAPIDDASNHSAAARRAAGAA